MWRTRSSPSDAAACAPSRENDVVGGSSPSHDPVRNACPANACISGDTPFTDPPRARSRRSSQTRGVLTGAARAFSLGPMTAEAPAADRPRDEESPWAPLRIRVFRALWLGSFVGFTGLWFQTVGAQWLLLDEPNASVLVALVQT